MQNNTQYRNQARIASVGKFLPARVVRNAELTQFPAESLPLIAEKTGVRERRHVSAGECTSDLAAGAARNALESGGLSAKDLDCLMLATSSPDRFQPATATRVQQLIGASKSFAFDINSVCSGAIYAFCVAESLIASGMCRNAMVVAAETYSRFLNPNDFATYPYFGDGAGAVLLTQSSGEGSVLGTVLGADGGGCDVIQVPGGGSMKPLAVCGPSDLYFRMRGKEVYQFAVTKGTQAIEEVLNRAGVLKESVKCVVAHQANVNIIAELSKRSGIPIEKFFVNLDKYGNTAAASVLIALAEVLETGTARTGDYVLLVAFGGGLSWGAMLVRI